MKFSNDLTSALLGLGAFVLGVSASSVGLAQEEVASVERGAQIAIIGGCHDCHTVGYAQSNGVVDPATALKGDPVGFQGPWGTTYPANLRIVAGEKSEDEWWST